MQALAIRTRRPVALIRNAISTRNVVPRRTQSDDEITVLAVGALTPQKDYPTLIRVAALVYPRVRATGRTIRFLVAGDGAAIAQLRAMVIEANLAGVVEFLGARRDVPELMSSASLLLMTSKFEGLPISLIEGLHAALPLIAPDVGGCNEMVKSGVNGFLTAPGDVAQIADRVLEIITNPNTIEAMSCESKLLAVEFSLDECVRKHIALYERVLEAAG